MSELKDLIEKYIKFEENIDDDNQDEINQLDMLGHEIDHLIYHEELTIVYNANTEDDEVVALIINDDDEYFIPVYTSQEEATKAIEVFKEESSESNFDCNKAVGNAIVQAYAEDDGFLGLAVDAPQCDFVIFSENVHDCCE